MELAVGFLFLGMATGFVIGMQYIPHQLKKRNPKIIKQVKELLSK